MVHSHKAENHRIHVTNYTYVTGT